MVEVLLTLFGIVIAYMIIGFKIVPQSQVYLVEKLGKYNRTLFPGPHLIVPFIENVKFQVSVLERQLPSRNISTITKDNVNIGVELAVLYRISEASKTFYRIQNVDQAIVTTVTGVVRSVIGKTDFDGVQTNRGEISETIQKELTDVMSEWGIVLSRVEIIDIDVDENTKEAMQLQLNAERTRRALVTEAEGKKQAAVLQADAELYTAEREADAKRVLSDANAYSLKIISQAINDGGRESVDFEMRKVYADAIKHLGNQASSKIVLLPNEIVENFSNSLKKIMK